MRQRRKPWAMPYLLENEKVIKINQQSLQPIMLKTKAELEIGVGKGDFINAKALTNPLKQYFGIETQPSVLAVAVKKAEVSNLNNLRFILGDAKHLIDVMPKHKFERIYINFPDPWPKARHEKRRLLYKSMLEIYQALLTKDGQIVFKTDNPNLYQYGLESLVANGYIILSNTNNYVLEKDDFATEYETKFRNKGLAIHRIVAKKG